MWAGAYLHTVKEGGAGTLHGNSQEWPTNKTTMAIRASRATRKARNSWECRWERQN